MPAGRSILRDTQPANSGRLRRRLFRSGFLFRLVFCIEIRMLRFSKRRMRLLAANSSRALCHCG